SINCLILIVPIKDNSLFLFVSRETKRSWTKEVAYGNAISKRSAIGIKSGRNKAKPYFFANTNIFAHIK
ncbi:hypothetical protein, partial [Staphylococcus aureus]